MYTKAARPMWNRKQRRAQASLDRSRRVTIETGDAAAVVHGYEKMLALLNREFVRWQKKKRAIKIIKLLKFW